MDSRENQGCLIWIHLLSCVFLDLIQMPIGFWDWSDIKFQLPKAKENDRAVDARPKKAEWLDYLVQQTTGKAENCEVLYMPGDEMEPRILKGSPIFVNQSINAIEGNGIYVLKYQGRTLVRIVENRIG